MMTSSCDTPAHPPRTAAGGGTPSAAAIILLCRTFESTPPQSHRPRTARCCRSIVPHSPLVPLHSVTPHQASYQPSSAPPVTCSRRSSYSTHSVIAQLTATEDEQKAFLMSPQSSNLLRQLENRETGATRRLRPDGTHAPCLRARHPLSTFDKKQLSCAQGPRGASYWHEDTSKQLSFRDTRASKRRCPDSALFSQK